MTVGFVVTVAVVLGLLLFLVHEIRRPTGSNPRWPKRLRIALGTILLMGGAVAGWAFFIEPNRLVTRYETIQIDQWPQQLSDLKIALLSDIHAGSAFID